MSKPKRAVAKRQAVAIEPTSSNQANDFISQAIAQKVPVETLEKLLAMRTQLKAESAKEKFDNAMAKFQTKCPEIKKTKAGSVTKAGVVAFYYAPLESIVAQVKGLLGKYGLSYSIKTEFKKEKVISTCIVKHIEGHNEESSMEVPIGASNPLTTQPQLVAGASTFSKRYAFCNAFGIMTGESDNEDNLRTDDPKITKSIEKLGKCTTPAKFNSVWETLPKEAKASPEVLREAKSIKDFILDAKKSKK